MDYRRSTLDNECQCLKRNRRRRKVRNRDIVSEIVKYSNTTTQFMRIEFSPSNNASCIAQHISRKCLIDYTRYTYLSRDYRMNRGAPIAHHEYKLQVREQFDQVIAVLQRQRILITESRSRFTVLDNHLQDEGRYG